MVRSSEFVERWGRPNIITRRHGRILHENHKSNILNNFYLTAAIRSIEFSTRGEDGNAQNVVFYFTMGW